MSEYAGYITQATYSAPAQIINGGSQVLCSPLPPQIPNQQTPPAIVLTPPNDHSMGRNARQVSGPAPMGGMFPLGDLQAFSMEPIPMGGMFPLGEFQPLNLHAATITLDCYRCKKVFGSEKALFNHFRDSKKHHVCTICPGGYLSETDFHHSNLLNDHLLGHRQCHLCLTPVAEDQLVDHMRFFHYYCVLCGDQCHSDAEIREHNISQHGFKSPLACICGIKIESGNASELLYHIELDSCPAMSSHTLLHGFNMLDRNLFNPPYGSPLYTHTAETLEALFKLCSTSRNGSKWVCTADGEMFNWSSALNRHLAGTVGPGYMGCGHNCAFCGRMFHAPSALMAHVERFHAAFVPPAPVIPYSELNKAKWYFALARGVDKKKKMEGVGKRGPLQEIHNRNDNQRPQVYGQQEMSKNIDALGFKGNKDKANAHGGVYVDPARVYEKTVNVGPAVQEPTHVYEQTIAAYGNGNTRAPISAIPDVQETNNAPFSEIKFDAPVTPPGQRAVTPPYDFQRSPAPSPPETIVDGKRIAIALPLHLPQTPRSQHRIDSGW